MWNLETVLSEFFFVLIGVIFILVGIKALRDSSLKVRITTSLFWFILAFTFIAGPHLPSWITGVCIVAIAVLSALKRVAPSKSDEPEPAKSRSQADKFGYKVFIPSLCLAVVAILAAVAAGFLPFGASNAIGIAAVCSVIVIFILLRAPVRLIAVDGSRMMDSTGSAGILAQILAALGSLFTAAGVGDVIAHNASLIIPEGNRLIACAVYCLAMALFTFVMGNGFAAFSVITVGIGLPFLILQGANPAVVGALGLTSGFCGTLCTPMAANFNIMPAALLKMNDKYAIIKAQLPMAGFMLCIHIALMYFLAF